ncbi:DUF6207 family protein [Micrococcus luteus]|uniref:DUF6207 family protein n=1 Tax=Micrococcus luteus TaxID=1270 RepID=UPI0033EDED43
MPRLGLRVVRGDRAESVELLLPVRIGGRRRPDSGFQTHASSREFGEVVMPLTVDASTDTSFGRVNPAPAENPGGDERVLTDVEPINEAHVAEPGQVVIEVAGLDDDSSPYGARVKRTSFSRSTRAMGSCASASSLSRRAASGCILGQEPATSARRCATGRIRWAAAD